MDSRLTLALTSWRGGLYQRVLGPGLTTPKISSITLVWGPYVNVPQNTRASRLEDFETLLLMRESDASTSIDAWQFLGTSWPTISTNALKLKPCPSSRELRMHQLQRLRAVADSRFTERRRVGVLVVCRGHYL